MGAPGSPKSEIYQGTYIHRSRLNVSLLHPVSAGSSHVSSTRKGVKGIASKLRGGVGAVEIDSITYKALYGIVRVSELTAKWCTKDRHNEGSSSSSNIESNNSDPVLSVTVQVCQ